MKIDRNLCLVAMLSLLLQACAGNLEPQSTYVPPPGASPTEIKSVDTGELEARTGAREDELGAEVIRYDENDEYQTIELSIPMQDEVDQVEVYTPSGETVPQSRQAQIVHDYETNNVGIKLHLPNTENTGFRFKLIDHEDDDWPPMRQQ